MACFFVLVISCLEKMFVFKYSSFKLPDVLKIMFEKKKKKSHMVHAWEWECIFVYMIINSLNYFTQRLNFINKDESIF